MAAYTSDILYTFLVSELTQFWMCEHVPVVNVLKHVFIHSFIHSFGHFYSAPSSPVPLRGAPDYSTDTVSEFHAEAHRQL